MIKEFEFYHGVVLTKLVQNTKSFGVKIRPYPTDSNASYIVDNDIGLYVKYSSKRMSPWRFSLQRIHQQEIVKMKNDLRDVFLVLVCGEDGLVTLSYQELTAIWNDNKNLKWISAARSPRKEYTIKGSDGILNRKVGKSDFPRKIFESETP